MASIASSRARSTPTARVSRRPRRRGTSRTTSRATPSSRDDDDEPTTTTAASLDAVLRLSNTTRDADADADEPTTTTREVEMAPTAAAARVTREVEMAPTAGRVTREVEVALTETTAARVSLTVRDATSRLVRATMRSPLGIVFEDVDGDIVVAEFYDESDLGPRGRGIKIGDVLRATSAMTPTMEYPKLNVIGGGVGRPGWRRVMYTCACARDGNLDDVTFDQAMKAIGSNAKAGDYDVALVFERFGG